MEIILISTKRNSRVSDKVGFKSGKLTVIEWAFTKNNQSFWKCLCECGNIKIVSRTNLGPKKTKSCGNCTPTDIMIYRRIKADYVQRSRINGIIFSLTENEFIELIQKNCYYCNSYLSNTKKIHESVESRAKGRSIKYNGLDRIDNTKGYEINNVRTCCSTCNVMKLTLTENEFYNHIKQIYNFRINTDNH